MKIKFACDSSRPASGKTLSRRRASLDITMKKPRRFSFGRKPEPEAELKPRRKSLMEEHEALKTRSLLRGRPTSVAAALLGSWKEGVAAWDSPKMTKRLASQSLSNLMEGTEQTTGETDDNACEDLHSDDTYVTLRPLDTRATSHDHTTRKENSPVPSKSVIRSVKMAANASTTRLMLSPAIRRIRSSSQFISPKRRRSIHVTSKCGNQPKRDTSAVLTSLKNDTMTFESPSYQSPRQTRPKPEDVKLCRSCSEKSSTSQKRLMKSWTLRRSSPARPRPRSFVRQASLPTFSSASKRSSSKRNSFSKSPRSNTAPHSQPITLQDVLDNKELLLEFRRFLEKECSSENLEFWQDCEEYRAEKPSKFTKVATKLYNTYLTPMSPKEINIDSATRADVMSKMKIPDATTFDSARDHVFQLMRKDSFPRFLSSGLTMNANDQKPR